MHSETLDNWRHHHVFLGAHHARNEGRTWLVVGLTAVMMAGEIIAGLAFGSMALLADGFHMATHAGALSIAGLAYWYARRHARDARFCFGTGKLGELAGYSSAMILAVVALMIGVESVFRLTAPVPIRFTEAIIVAVIGLAVNLLSAWLLHAGDAENDHHHDDAHAQHHHDEGHGHHHHGHDDHGHEDHNLRSAYFHVLTDALTSVLAIAALVTGWLYGWVWMDPLMGIVGAVVIARWSWGLLKGAGAVLLDMSADDKTEDRIRASIESDGDRIADLHLWRVGPGHIAAIVSVVSDRPQEPQAYKSRLAQIPKLSHVTIEVHRCPHERQAA